MGEGVEPGCCGGLPLMKPGTLITGELLLGEAALELAVGDMHAGERVGAE